MSKKQYIKELEEQIKFLLEVRDGNEKHIKELEEANQEFAVSLAGVLNTDNEEPDYGTPENPVILNDVINSILAKGLMAIDECG